MSRHTCGGCGSQTDVQIHKGQHLCADCRARVGVSNVTLFCDNCGGVRVNGAPVTLKDGETVLAHGGTPRRKITGYWCRTCLRDENITLYP